MVSSSSFVVSSAKPHIVCRLKDIHLPPSLICFFLAIIWLHFSFFLPLFMYFLVYTCATQYVFGILEIWARPSILTSAIPLSHKCFFFLFFLEGKTVFGQIWYHALKFLCFSKFHLHLNHNMGSYHNNATTDGGSTAMHSKLSPDMYIYLSISGI